MTKTTSSLFIATLLALCLQVVAAQAQYVRTCVSANGNDANTCHCSQPCRSFQRAHDQTLPDGEITVLDPSGYGPVAITKSISIVNDGGGEASVQVSGGGTGITVNAPPGAGYVNLRGITIQGVGFGGGTGLRFNTGFTLTMTNCVIRNHTGDGIDFVPTSSSNLAISNSLVGDNGGAGINVAPSGSSVVKASFYRVEAYNNSGDGFLMSTSNSSGGGGIRGAVKDSVAANNFRGGFTATAVNGLVLLHVFDSLAFANQSGFQGNNAGSNVFVGNSVLSQNGSAWVGNVFSFGDNYVIQNGGNDPPAPGGLVNKK